VLAPASVRSRARADKWPACARDEQRESRGAVGARLLGWQSDSAAKLITRACSRVNRAVSVERQWGCSLSSIALVRERGLPG
jgi:hypothetical protein